MNWINVTIINHMEEWYMWVYVVFEMWDVNVGDFVILPRKWFNTLIRL